MNVRKLVDWVHLDSSEEHKRLLLDLLSRFVSFSILSLFPTATRTKETDLIGFDLVRFSRLYLPDELFAVDHAVNEGLSFIREIFTSFLGREFPLSLKNETLNLLPLLLRLDRSQLTPVRFSFTLSFEIQIDWI